MPLDVHAFRDLRRGQRLTLNDDVFSVQQPLAGDLFSVARYLLVGGWGGQFVLNVPVRGAITFKPGFGAVRTVRTALVDGAQVPSVTAKKTTTKSARKAKKKTTAKPARMASKEATTKSARKAKKKTTAKPARMASKEATTKPARKAKKKTIARPNRNAKKKTAQPPRKIESQVAALGRFRRAARTIERRIETLRDTGDGDTVKLMAAVHGLEDRTYKTSAYANAASRKVVETRLGGLRIAVTAAGEAGRHRRQEQRRDQISDLKAQERTARGERALSPLEQDYQREVQAAFLLDGGRPSKVTNAGAVRLDTLRPGQRFATAQGRAGTQHGKSRHDPYRYKVAWDDGSEKDGTKTTLLHGAIPVLPTTAASKPKTPAVTGIGLVARMAANNWPKRQPHPWPTGETTYALLRQGQRFYDDANECWTKRGSVLDGDFTVAQRDDGRVVVLPSHSRGTSSANHLMVKQITGDGPAMPEPWMVKGDHSIETVIRALGYFADSKGVGKVHVWKYVGEVGKGRHREVVCKGDVIDVWNCFIDKGLLRETARPTEAEIARNRRVLHHRQTRDEIRRFNGTATKLGEGIGALKARGWDGLADADLKKLRKRLAQLDARTRKKVITRSPDDAQEAQRRVEELRERLEQVVDGLPASRAKVQDEERAGADDRRIAQRDFDDRREARIDRLEERAEKKREASEAQYQGSKDILGRRPMGQPILVDHYSAPKHRRDLARADNKMRKSFELGNEANELDRRASAAANNNAISSDDPSASDQLVTEVLQLEDKIDHWVAINKAIGPPVKASKRTAAQNERARVRLGQLGIDDAYAEELLKGDFMDRLGIPGYQLRNARANARAKRKRIEALAAVAAVDGREQIYPTAVGEVRVVQEDNRVRVFFSKKLDGPFRKRMRNPYGFIRAHSVGAWQRKANEGAWRQGNLAAQAYAAQHPPTEEQSRETSSESTGEAPSVETRNGVIYYRNVKDRDSKRGGKSHVGRVLVDQHADVTPRKSIRIHGNNKNSDTYRDSIFDRTFSVGDEAFYPSYDRAYIGVIVSIGKSTVKIQPPRSSQAKRLSVYEFVDLNKHDRLAFENANKF